MPVFWTYPQYHPPYRQASPDDLSSRMGRMSVYDHYEHAPQPQQPWSVEYHHRHGVDENGKPYSETNFNADVGEERDQREGLRAYSPSPGTHDSRFGSRFGSRYGSRYGSQYGGSRTTCLEHGGSRAIEPPPPSRGYSQTGKSHYESSRISVDTNSLPDGPRTRGPGPGPRYHDNDARRGASNPGVEDWIRKSQGPERRGRGAPPSAYRGPGGASRAPSRGPSRAPSRAGPSGDMGLVPYKETRFRSADARGGGRTVHPADSISQVSRRSRR